MGSERASRPGPAPAWNGVGFGMAAVAIAALVILYAPSPPDPDPPATTDPSRTITLDELEAMLTNDTTGPETVEVETPDGPVTVVIPTTTRPPATTTSTTSAPPTTTTTTTTTPPRRPGRPPVDAQDILDDLLGAQAPAIPEGAGGEE